jgi:putative endonuclease
VPFVYIVACSDGTFYTGWAVDVQARVATHNAGRGSTYCRQRRPVRLVYQEEVTTRTEAMRREQAIKRMSHASKIKLIEQLE